MHKNTFYKYEDKHNCPKCNGNLKFTGAINEYDMFTCIKCNSNFQVDRRYKLNKNNYQEFCGYGIIKEI